MAAYMSFVVRAMDLISATPGGVSWGRLLERIDVLRSAKKNDKARVYQHLMEKSNVWNNGADDMSETIFMIGENPKKAEKEPETVAAESSKTKLPTASTSKKTEKFNKYTTIMRHPTPPAAAAEPHTPSARTGLPDKMEADIIAEMAWHVQCAGDHGLTITALRMSVPEFNDSDDAERVYLIKTMQQRFNIGYYEKLIGEPSHPENRTIRVLLMRAGARPIVRPDYFIYLQRPVRQRYTAESTGIVKPNIATFGAVSNNAMADAFAGLNALALFQNNAGKEEDEYDEEDNVDIETEGAMPTSKQEDPSTAEPTPEETAEPVFHADEVDEPVNVSKPVPTEQTPALATPTTTPVTPEAVSNTADVLRQIADQLESHSQFSESISKARQRFDLALKAARSSADELQLALDKHQSLMNDLEQAADDLTSL